MSQADLGVGAGENFPRSPYHDRARHPAATVETVRPYFPQLGITRLARQTHLDRIGIPCWAAIRPNSKTLATNAGKGCDDVLAMASAAMEAAEYAIAEHPRTRPLLASEAELVEAGQRIFPIDRLVHPKTAGRKSSPLAWLEGKMLLTGETCWVPAPAIRLGQQDAPEISCSTNGLASGNTPDEALLHAICELIERDAYTLWALKGGARHSHKIDPALFEDAMVSHLARQIDAADLSLSLFDQTSDIGVPVILALIGPKTEKPFWHFDIAAGAGCHPHPARAALRAITEAAQTRIVNIASARDDIDPTEFEQPVAPALAKALEAESGAPVPSGIVERGSTPSLLSWVTEKLLRSGAGELLVVPLGGEEFGISVIKLFSPVLEDRMANPFWRPGARAIASMMRARTTR